MKTTHWLIALAMAATLLLFVACGKKQTPDQPVAESPAEATVEQAPVAAEEATEEAEDTQEVVEESAADAAPDEDEPIVLAQADTSEAATEWKFAEGKDYVRMVPTQPTFGGADKIEVAEFFWYGCPHCFDFEPYVNRWVTEKPANVRLVKIPIVWNQVAMLHGQVYYTAELLAKNGVIDDVEAFHTAVFQEYHRRGNRLASEGAIRKVFDRFGVTPEQFDNTWNSFEVNQLMRKANDLMRRYKIDSVPAVVVNGKYRAGAAEVGSYPSLLELIDELIVRESAR
jgi:thiol:disulfide interchange protein DsbA